MAHVGATPRESVPKRSANKVRTYDAEHCFLILKEGESGTGPGDRNGMEERTNLERAG